MDICSQSFLFREWETSHHLRIRKSTCNLVKWKLQFFDSAFLPWEGFLSLILFWHPRYCSWWSRLLAKIAIAVVPGRWGDVLFNHARFNFIGPQAYKIRFAKGKSCKQDTKSHPKIFLCHWVPPMGPSVFSCLSLLTSWYESFYSHLHFFYYSKIIM